MTIPEWLHKGASVQVNPDTVRKEWTMAWMGVVGVVERIDERLHNPVVVSFPNDQAWYHFEVDEVMEPPVLLKPPDMPEYVRIPRAEYDALKEKASYWDRMWSTLDSYHSFAHAFWQEEFAAKGNIHDVLASLHEWQERAQKTIINQIMTLGQAKSS